MKIVEKFMKKIKNVEEKILEVGGKKYKDKKERLEQMRMEIKEVEKETRRMKRIVESGTAILDRIRAVRNMIDLIFAGRKEILRPGDEVY
jgi:hypothetical protein